MSLRSMEQCIEEMKRQAKELIEQAYQRGYRAGYSKAENDYHAKTEEDRQSSYELGLNMAWEAAKKIYLTTSEGGLPNEEIVKIFDVGWMGWIATIFKNFSASEVVEKLKAYEEQKNQEEDSEIKVGDEVIYRHGELTGIVTSIYKTKKFDILWNDGSVGQEKNISDFKKTGRTFPEIVAVLKKMQEE